jgi:anti-anti-sigma factor
MPSPLLPDPYLLKTADHPAVLVLTLGPDSLSNETNADRWLQQGQSAVVESKVLRVLIDCEQLGPVYAAGLTKVLKIYRDLYQAGGELALCQLPRSFQEVIHVTRMDKVLKLYPNREKAIEALADRK